MMKTKKYYPTVFRLEKWICPRTNALYVFVLLLWITAGVGLSACSPRVEDVRPPLIIGLDHIPLAVADLDRAAEQYRKLGFSLKPGRTHENGIQNQHIKFPDGTEIELISVSGAQDALTAEYTAHLVSGDGPAFVGFYTANMSRLAEWFAGEDYAYTEEGRLLTFAQSDGLRYIFFGQRNLADTDLPEHFEHPNSAEALIGVWIAADDLERERQLLSGLGAEIKEEEVYAPDLLNAAVAGFPQGEVVFLPGSQQQVPGRRIIGAVIRTKDIEALSRALTENFQFAPLVVETGSGRSIFVPPEVAYGIWLEFRQVGD